MRNARLQNEFKLTRAEYDLNRKQVTWGRKRSAYRIPQLVERKNTAEKF
jgi:hypothetical protein